MKNSAYWRRRFEAIEKTAVKSGLSYNERLEKEYYKAMKSIEGDIARWYQRFANNNEISMAEAKRLLNTRELKEFRWTVEDYIKYGVENKISQEWQKELENASAKVHITRLEALEVQLQQEVEKLYGNQLDDVDKLARGIYTDTYYHTVFEIQKGFNVGWNLQRFNEKQLQHVVETPWTLDEKTFSDRIWLRKEELLKTARTELSQTIIRGDAPDKAIKNIASKFDVDKHKAGRLVMTESAYFASAAQKQCFNDLDVEKYEIVATLDSHTSEICQELDGQVRDMKDYQEGVTAPPFHPWCRTTTVPYFEDEYGKRAARGEDGKTYYVPANMTYKEWKEKYVDGNEIKVEMSSDELQYYRKTKIDVNDVLKEERYGKPIRSYKMVLFKNQKMYLSETTKKLKPKKLHTLYIDINESYKILGKTFGYNNINELEKPAIAIISNTEMNKSIPASYSAIKNIMFLNEKLFTVGENKKELQEGDTIHTILHELLHWYDAQNYMKKNDVITQGGTYNKYIRYLNNEAKKTLEIKNIDVYNISKYATKCYNEGKYNEVYTEYRVYKLLKNERGE